VAEEIALHFGTANRLKLFQLVLRFNAFCCRYNAQAFGKACDCADEGERFGSIREIIDEGTIDLNLVEGKTPEVTERGVTGPEIIQCNLHAEVA
jgi:hypothetical protein